MKMESLERTRKKAEAGMATLSEAMRILKSGELDRMFPKFKPGQKVWKVGGRYGGPGRIVGTTIALDDDGYFLYNVAMKVEGGYGEFVHVFPESVLQESAA